MQGERKTCDAAEGGGGGGGDVVSPAGAVWIGGCDALVSGNLAWVTGSYSGIGASL